MEGGGSRKLTHDLQLEYEPIEGESASDVERALQLQRLLAEAGAYDGTIDGNKDRRTLLAVASFQETQGLRVDGFAGPETWRTLRGGKPVPFGSDERRSTMYLQACLKEASHIRRRDRRDLWRRNRGGGRGFSTIERSQGGRDRWLADMGRVGRAQDDGARKKVVGPGKLLAVADGASPRSKATAALVFFDRPRTESLTMVAADQQARTPAGFPNGLRQDLCP
jgi:hypothetical protein